MEYDIDVKMTIAALFDYNMHYTYTSASGIIGTAAGVCLILTYMGNRELIYLGAGLLLILYTPFTLLYRAIQQVKLNPVYKHPIHYHMDDTGITVTQGEDSVAVEWEDMYRAASTNLSIVLYTGKKIGWIIPKSSISEEKYRLIEMISTHMPPDKVRIRQ